MTRDDINARYQALVDALLDRARETDDRQETLRIAQEVIAIRRAQVGIREDGTLFVQPSVKASAA